MTKDADYVAGGGNVFADLGLEDAEAMRAKAELALAILQAIRRRKLTQDAAAELLQTDRTSISKLKRGRELRKFSFDRLLNWLTRLDLDVTLHVAQKAKGRSHGCVRVAP